MKILTVRQPWATAIITLGKDVENRTRNIAGDYRGPVAIHTSKREEPIGGDAAKRILELTGYFPLFATKQGLGTIIGVVDLWAVHPDRDNGNCCRHRPSGGPGGSPWADRDVWHLCLNNPRRLVTPIPYKGALGLRDLDADTERAVLEQLAATEEQA